MTLKEANEIFPRFQHLKGQYSESYKCYIEDVFITFMDSTLAQADYEYRVMKNPDDDGHYTIVAALDNKKLLSIKTIVLADHHTKLWEDVKLVDMMF